MGNDHGFYSWLAEMAGVSRQYMCKVGSNGNRLSDIQRRRLCIRLGIRWNHFETLPEQKILTELRGVWHNRHKPRLIYSYVKMRRWHR